MAKKSIEINIVSEEQIQHHSSAYDIQTIDIQHLIRDIRGQQIILDYDLAKLYGVETKQLNRQVKRNIERFPEDFMFQLTENEVKNLKCQFGTSSWGGSRYKPYAFTENGIAMLSGVLRSQVAIDVNIRIMRTFVAMRRFVANTSHIFKRLETLEYHQLETDKRIDGIFQLMERQETTPKQGIFFDGQIYDAYTFVADLVRSAKRQIILIDNYIDDTVLSLLDKRESTVQALIYTAHISKALKSDIEHHNAQYTPIEVKIYKKSHDRFLMIDDNIYLIGASIKDLGRKLFGFSLMQNLSVTDLLKKIEQ